jgi:hypothetical protein
MITFQAAWSIELLTQGDKHPFYASGEVQARIASLGANH